MVVTSTTRPRICVGRRTPQKATYHEKLLHLRARREHIHGQRLLALVDDVVLGLVLELGADAPPVPAQPRALLVRRRTRNKQIRNKK